MKTLYSIFLIVLPFFTFAQRIDLLNEKGQVKQSIYPGTVFYQLHGDKKVYINEFVDIKGDTLFLADNYFLKDEIAFIDPKNMHNNLSFACCNCLNLTILPFQFGLLAIIYQIENNGNADFGDEIVPILVGSYLGGVLIRRTVSLIRDQAFLNGKNNCKNCSYQFVEKADEPNLNLYQN